MVDAMTTTYDAIVVGARCAGAPTAMLLAQAGHRVLVVDKATFPSDTVSTHMIHAPGVAALRRWGLLDEVVASRAAHRSRPTPSTSGPSCSPARACRSTAAPPATHPAARCSTRSSSTAPCEPAPRCARASRSTRCSSRTASCAASGATAPTVSPSPSARRVVIGADGRSSRVARAVQPEEYLAKPVLQQGFYTYFRDLPVDGFEIYIRPDRGWGAFPTNDGLTLVVVGWPSAEADAFKTDPEANFLMTLELAPAFAERVRGATRVERLTAAAVPNFFRKPYGPGWVLVGDAGYTKDPITAQGMPDAFLDAERIAAALDDVFARPDRLRRRHARRPRGPRRPRPPRLRLHHRPWPPWHRRRPSRSSCSPPPTATRQAIDGFVSLTTGALSPADYFSDANVASIMAGV